MRKDFFFTVTAFSSLDFDDIFYFFSTLLKSDCDDSIKKSTQTFGFSVRFFGIEYLKKKMMPRIGKSWEICDTHEVISPIYILVCFKK